MLDSSGPATLLTTWADDLNRVSSDTDIDAYPESAVSFFAQTEGTVFVDASDDKLACAIGAGSNNHHAQFNHGIIPTGNYVWEAEMLATGGSHLNELYVRMPAGANSGYFAALITSGIQFSRLDNGTPNGIDTHSQSFTAGQWYRVQIEVTAGSSAMRVRAETSPGSGTYGSWFTSTDATYASGRPGAGFFAPSGTSAANVGIRRLRLHQMIVAPDDAKDFEDNDWGYLDNPGFVSINPEDTPWNPGGDPPHYLLVNTGEGSNYGGQTSNAARYRYDMTFNVNGGFASFQFEPPYPGADPDELWFRVEFKYDGGTPSILKYIRWFNGGTSSNGFGLFLNNSQGIMAFFENDALTFAMLGLYPGSGTQAQDFHEDPAASGGVGPGCVTYATNLDGDGLWHRLLVHAYAAGAGSIPCVQLWIDGVPIVNPEGAIASADFQFQETGSQRHEWHYGIADIAPSLLFPRDGAGVTDGFGDCRMCDENNVSGGKTGYIEHDNLVWASGAIAP